MCIAQTKHNNNTMDCDYLKEEMEVNKTRKGNPPLFLCVALSSAMQRDACVHRVAPCSSCLWIWSLVRGKGASKLMSETVYSTFKAIKE